MYIRLSFLYQYTDKMTKHPSQGLCESLSLYVESSSVTYLISKLRSLYTAEIKPQMNWISIGIVARLLGINPIYGKNEGPPQALARHNVRWLITSEQCADDNATRQGAAAHVLPAVFNRVSAQSETWAMQMVLKRNNVWESNLILQQVVRTVRNVIVSRFRFFQM